MEKYYKVVSIVDGKKKSAFVENTSFSKAFSVEYNVNEKTYPKVKTTCLYVFSNKYSAEDYVVAFIGDGWVMELWECEVENPRPCKLLGLSYYIADFWDSPNEMRYAKTSPQNTISCDSVTLLRKVS